MHFALVKQEKLMHQVELSPQGECRQNLSF